jgi:PAS domain S-box-containing protein
MKNRNLYILLGVAFLLLLGVFILFRNAQKEVMHYKQTVTQSHLLLNEFRELSGNLKSVQIMTKDFKGLDPTPIRQGLQPTIERINLNLIKLQKLNYDPESEERLIRIGQTIYGQFQLFETYMSTPDSIALGAAALNNLSYASTRSIDSSIVRTETLLENGSIQLDRTVDQLTLWIVVFGLIAFAILAYATIAILKQVQKTREAEGFLQSVLNTTQNGILACSAIKDKRKIVDYRIDYVNPGFEQITGMKKDTVIGQPLSKIYQSLVKLPLHQILEAIQDKPYQFTRRLQLGRQKKWLQISISRMDNQNTITLNDVSELKSIESNLKHKIEELEYTNGQLEQFAYVASHDLQEPLRKIQTFSELAHRNIDNQDSELSEYIQKISTSSKRVSKLVSDLLNFSLLKREVQFEPVDLNTIIENVKGDFELLLAEKKAVIEVEGKMPVVEAEPLQMNQLFYNLISNALKFSKPDVPPRIRITSRLEQEEGARQAMGESSSFHHITITDNGIGFEKDYADQIFEIFRRLHSSQAYSGSGIGLAVCKKIVLNHNGKIYAESDGESGTTIHVLLPAVA